ncbi:hypothetical protein Lal_00003080 [Lupinus albus]|uniref:Putative plastoquinol--plastocyanin reductase n=1 Tax=Lupinus albus TaxID=3870 RepID=A0A6A4NPL8_LUPAL|nr:putative plastoquinol--plastocyanin reductase [Lupinus albus]KAF1882898.1 hypothetical protein Lal_00003080 [Lupinus albus]
MASTTLSHATLSHVSSGKSEIFCSSQAQLVKHVNTKITGKGMKVTCEATSIAPERVLDMEKRKLMNLLLLGAISLPTAGMLVPYATFFVP